MTIINKKKELDKIIKKSKDIYIMGHRDLDLDAIGSAIGLCEYIKKYNKDVTIIINDRRKESGVKKVLDILENKYNIKKGNEIEKNINSKSLLIIVDTNKKFLLQDEELFEQFNNIIVIDHHDLKESSMDKGLLIIDEDTSSTCEMIAELIDAEKIKLDADIATTLLSGIVLDTNNFIIKTRAKTYKIAYILTEMGAEPKKVQFLLKQNIKEYISRQKVLTNIKVYKKIAIATAKSNVTYRREDLAKIADTLLQFSNIETSFVIGKLDKNTVGISARSTGIVNVGDVLEMMNGGGDEHEAGTKIDDSSIKNVEKELRKNINKMY